MKLNHAILLLLVSNFGFPCFRRLALNTKVIVDSWGGSRMGESNTGQSVVGQTAEADRNSSLLLGSKQRNGSLLHANESYQAAMLAAVQSSTTAAPNTTRMGDPAAVLSSTTASPNTTTMVNGDHQGVAEPQVEEFAAGSSMDRSHLPCPSGGLVAKCELCENDAHCTLCYRELKGKFIRCSKLLNKVSMTGIQATVAKLLFAAKGHKGNCWRSDRGITMEKNLWCDPSEDAHGGFNLNSQLPEAATCASYKCGAGLAKKQNADSLKPASDNTCCEVFKYFRLSDAPSIGVGRKVALNEIRTCKCGGKDEIKCFEPKENAAPFTMVKIALDVELFWFFHIKVGGNVMTRDWTEESPSYRSFSLNAALSFKLPIGGLELSATGTLLFRTKEGKKLNNLFWYGLRSVTTALMEKFMGGLENAAEAQAKEKKEQMQRKYLTDVQSKLDMLKVPHWKTRNEPGCNQGRTKKAYDTFMQQQHAELKKKSEILVREVQGLASNGDWKALKKSVQTIKQEMPEKLPQWREGENLQPLVDLVNKCDAYARFVHTPGILAKLQNKSYSHAGLDITQLEIWHSATYIVTGMAIKVANLVYKLFFTGDDDNGPRLGDWRQCSFDARKTEGHITCLLMRLIFSEVPEEELVTGEKGYLTHWPLPKGLTGINAKTSFVESLFARAMGKPLANDLHEAGFIRIPFEAFAPVEKVLSGLAERLRALFARIRMNTQHAERNAHKEFTDLSGQDSYAELEMKLMHQEWRKHPRSIDDIDNTIEYVEQTIQEFGLEQVLDGALVHQSNLNNLFPSLISEVVAEKMLASDLLAFKLMLQKLGVESTTKLGCTDEAMKYFVRLSCVLQVSLGDKKKSAISGAAAYGWLFEVQSATEIQAHTLVFKHGDIVSKHMRMMKTSMKLGGSTLGLLMKQQGKNFENDYYVLGKFSLSVPASSGIAALIPEVVKQAVIFLHGILERKDKDEAFNDDLEKLKASKDDLDFERVQLERPNSLTPNITLGKCAFLGGAAAALCGLDAAGLTSSKVSLVFNVLYTRFPSQSTAFDVSLALESATTLKAGVPDWLAYILPVPLPKISLEAALINTFDLSTMLLDVMCKPSDGAVRLSRQQALQHLENHKEHVDHGSDGSDDSSSDDDGGDPGE